MVIPTYTTEIEKLFTLLDKMLDNYIFHGYSALADYLRYPLLLAIILYIVILGICITQGWVKLSVNNLVKSVLKLALIYLAAMSWGWFSQNVVDLLSRGAGQIGDILVGASPMPLPHFGGEGINGAMQSVLIEFVRIGDTLWEAGSFTNLGPLFDAVVVWGFGYALIAIAVFELTLAKIMLAVLLATAPLFVGFTLFKPTHGFFDRWLGACVGFALLMIFVSSMLALALSITQWSIAGMIAERAVNISLVGIAPIIITGFLGIGIILKSAHLAQAIGGTFTTVSGSSLLAGTIGGAVGSAFTAMRMPLTSARGLGSFFSAGSKRSSSTIPGQQISAQANSNMMAIREKMVKGGVLDETF